MSFFPQMKGETPMLSPGEEEAHGRDHDSDVLPV